MANTTIKITQLPSIGNGLSASTILPVVNTTGTATTDKVSIGSVANYILTEAGNTLQPAYISSIALSVANAAQPNITSVGNLNINTLHITGGDNGYYLQTDGGGNLAWVAGGGSGNGEVGGSNSQLQFNLSGNFAGDPDLTWDAGNNKLITANLSVSGNANVGNVNTVNVNASGNARPNAIYTDNYYYANGDPFIASNTVPGGDNTQVQFNDAGNFGGDSDFTYDAGNNILNVIRANVSYLTAYTSVNGGNSVTANYFIGSGANLSNIAGANVSGFVPNANVANTAFSVAGANVSGFVPNANVANTAFAVAAANVSGLGNIATINLTGSNSNVLYGNGVFAPATTTYGNSNVANYLPTFTGNLSGNSLTVQQDVSGNGALRLQGIANGNSTINIGGEADIDIVANVGNINLYTANNQPWIFDQDGNLTLPGNTFAVNYANGTQVNIGGGGNANTGNVTFNDVNIIGDGNLYLQPDPNNNGAYLDVYLTGGPDVHIAGNGETVIVGSDEGANVSVQASGNVAIQANAVFGGNSHTWMFDYYGNITLPGNTFSVNYANGQQVQLGGGANLGNFEFPNPTSNTSTITVNDGSDIVINPTYGGSSPAYINVPGSINGPTTEPLQIFNGYFAGNASASAVSIGADILKGITIFGDGSVATSNTLTVPASDNGSIIFSSDGTTNNGSLKVDGGYNMTLSANSNFYVKRAGSDRLAITDTNTDLMAASNVVIHANKAGSEQNWIFDTTGNLRTPGNVDIYGAINFPQQVSSINWSTYNIELSQYGRINTNVDFFANANVIGAQYLKGDGSNISNISISGGTNPISTSGNVTAGNVTSNGSVTANTFVGNISGSNVTGTVANANYSVYSGTASVANSVAAANISGTINLANYATTANSVAGANVSGAVAYATTANSVAVANVSGIGNIATINKDGNSSNILYGNGVFASAPVTYGNSNVATFLASYGSNTISTTGNVTAGNANLGNAVTANYHIGNLYGTANLAVYATTANAVAGANVSGQVGNALVAGTVYTNAQPNITSVGTLTSLAVTGNITNGNVTGGNLVSANYLTGTLTTAAQPNITSTGTLSNLTVSGNVSAGNVILNGQTVALTGAVNPDYIQVEKSADQTFVAKNADINFNVTTATNGGIAYASNIFTLTAGKTYLLEATLCINNFTSTSAFIWWSWVDATTNAQLDTSNGGAVSTGSSGVAIPATWTANDNYSSTAKLIYTPNTTQTVKLRATDGSGTCTVLAVGTRASIVQINPTASLSAVSTINASGNISVGGNLTVAGNIIGNVIGTSPNVTLVAGSYSYTFDNTGNFTLPANSDILMTGVNSVLSAGGTTLLGGYSQVGGSYSTLGVKYPGAGTQFGMTLQPTNDNTTAIQFLNAAGNSIGNIKQTSSTVQFVGDGSQLSNVATQTTGSWTLAPGTNTVSLTVPINGTYSIWVRGNIPNGIVTYTATVVVTNTNVPVLGTSYGWYYAAGNALVLTAIPAQIVGTLNNISNAVVATTTANVFTFGITNNSGTSQVVSYGYTKLG
jgi:hypothetical protein